ncbi:MAG: hypothetical protein SGPRY_010046 [Prymnesium sp.]
MLRALERVPWQASGAAALCSLVGIGVAAEASVRDPPCVAAVESRGGLFSDALVKELRHSGYVVIEHAIDDETLAKARSECSTLRANGAFEQTEQHSSRIRSDLILWMDRQGAEDAGVGMSAALVFLRSIASRLATESPALPGWFSHGNAQLGVTRAAQLACYPSLAQTEEGEGEAVGAGAGGSRYKTHRDGIWSFGLQVGLADAQES